MTVVLSANQGDQAYIDRVDASGFTALHWAVISHHFAFAKMLLEAGARVDIEDAKGKTSKYLVVGVVIACPCVFS